MALPTRPLGKTGMEVTRVGFGSWAAGGGGWAFSWGPQDDEQSISAIRHAVESGVNWVDTAAVYGLGHSEEVVAAAMEGIPVADRPYIFTKCGLVWDDNDRYKPALRVGAPDSIRAGAEASLRRLKVDVLDLLQMHWPPDDGARVEDYWGAMLELKEQGKVRAIGLSNHSVERLEKAEPVGHVDTLQPPFSAIKRTTATEIAWCADHSTGVIVYSPMQAGLLTGAFTAGTCGRPAQRRLAGTRPPVPGRAVTAQPGPDRGFAAHRPRARDLAGRHRRGLGTVLAGRHGRHCRGAQRPTGGRVATRRPDRAHAGRARAHCRRHRGHRRRRGPGHADIWELTTAGPSGAYYSGPGRSANRRASRRPTFR